jgi:hypothetical protein
MKAIIAIEDGAFEQGVADPADFRVFSRWE